MIDKHKPLVLEFSGEAIDYVFPDISVKDFIAYFGQEGTMKFALLYFPGTKNLCRIAMSPQIASYSFSITLSRPRRMRR